MAIGQSLIKYLPNTCSSCCSKAAKVCWRRLKTCIAALPTRADLRDRLATPPRPQALVSAAMSQVGSEASDALDKLNTRAWNAEEPRRREDRA
jgi:hypothetical protein